MNSSQDHKFAAADSTGSVQNVDQKVQEQSRGGHFRSPGPCMAHAARPLVINVYLPCKPIIPFFHFLYDKDDMPERAHHMYIQ